MRGKPSLLTYNEISVSPASILGVARLFVENRPADIRHSRLPWENIGGDQMARTNEQRITTALKLEMLAMSYRDSRPDIAATALKSARLLRRITARTCAEARA